MTRLRDEIKQTRPFSSLAQEALLSIERTAARIDHAFAEVMRPYGITPTQYNVLRILRGAGPAGLCRSEVGERMISPVPDATRLLDRMEAAGLITRERSTEDRRYVTARITDEGLRLLDALEAPVAAVHRRHIGGLDDAELRALIDQLGRIRASL